MNDDLLIFSNEDQPSGLNLAPWSILVVDDDHDIHLSTALVLKNVQLLGRPIVLTHAYSAHEAFELLLKHHDFAIILLDVVMENDFAGLDLVAKIRGILGLKEIRIILRTGQPGHAPEPGIFNLHDINDYRLKTELTSNRLITALSSALRSYEQICAISANRRGLEMIVHAESQLMECTQFSDFCQVILVNAAKIFDRSCTGFVATLTGLPPTPQDFGACSPQLVAESLELLRTRPAYSVNHCFDLHEAWLFLQAGLDQAVIYLRFDLPLNEFINIGQIASVFAANTSACLGHLRQLERLNYLAYHDELTGLGNRTWFIDQLGQSLSALRPPHAVAILDLCRFADINDGLGYEAGNALLCSFAKRLQQHFADSETLLARLGNDVFGLFGPLTLVNPDSLFELFKPPLQALQHTIPVQISVGIRAINGEHVNGLQLLEQANIALNLAKSKPHPRWASFSPAMEANTRWRHEVIRQLRLAFQSNILQVWYQPQIDLNTKAICGMEALLRWPGEVGFIQSPAVFIPLAEYSGLIVEMGEWVMDESCRAYKELSSLPHSPERVAVNVSMPQFRTGNLLERVRAILAKHDLPGSALELEITESIAMDEPENVRSTLLGLREIGVQIAIDDFGTGYSSLGQLRALPIDCLKIDKSFVDDIDADKSGLYVEMIVGLAQRLGLSTVAEGVETQRQAERLQHLGCTIAQGYFYAKPMPLATLKEWLMTRQAN
ncbi:EAL domain-containing protein [Chitinibacter bivalviorum]|uniref:EAL domain-containing protein n=1 Tax=Chitinibacter bivalviorum TaxID=2739434 RepID=A0A7H9BHR6_9NEIS|nr:EAL domain-containing protein [Chitinibacter bivalviorum]QLG87491.1 EAL domain-containing protein [Chitinibacter bivalviorum]